ncbi:MAG: hypothetical protein QXP27_05130 [Candidatus Methanomethyliaceae archaeon]
MSETKARLKELYEILNPVELQRRIQRELGATKEAPWVTIVVRQPYGLR